MDKLVGREGTRGVSGEREKKQKQGPAEIGQRGAEMKRERENSRVGDQGSDRDQTGQSRDREKAEMEREWIKGGRETQRPHSDTLIVKMHSDSSRDIGGRKQSLSGAPAPLTVSTEPLGAHKAWPWPVFL